MFLYSTVSTLNPRHTSKVTAHSLIVRHECLTAHEPTDGRDGGDDFTQLQLVEDRRFPRGVQPHHQDPHLLLSNEAFQQIPKNIPHDCDPAASAVMQDRDLSGRTEAKP